jgi:hypothetical protein
MPFMAYIWVLQRRGLIDVAGPGDLGITEVGIEAIGANPPDEPQWPAQLVAMWHKRIWSRSWRSCTTW